MKNNRSGTKRNRTNTSVTLSDGTKVRAQNRHNPFEGHYLYATEKEFNGIKADNARELVEKCEARRNEN
jgi:hypothetical protein